VARTRGCLGWSTLTPHDAPVGGGVGDPLFSILLDVSADDGQEDGGTPDHVPFQAVGPLEDQ